MSDVPNLTGYRYPAESEGASNHRATGSPVNPVAIR